MFDREFLRHAHRNYLIGTHDSGLMAPMAAVLKVQQGCGAFLRNGLPAVFALTLLIAHSSPAQNPGFGDLGGYWSFSYGDGSAPPGIPNSTGQQTSPDGQQVKLYGSLGPISGADWASGFVVYWNGGYSGPINPADKFVSDLTFNVQVTGGNVSWDYYADLFSTGGYEDARIATDSTPMPASGEINGAHFESNPFTTSGTDGYFESYVHLDWTGYSPTDTLTISIPQNSVDVTYVPAPEPGSVSLAACCALGAWGFRRFASSRGRRQ